MVKSYQQGKPMRTENHQEFLTLYSDHISDYGDSSHGEITLLNTERIQGGWRAKKTQGTFYWYPF